MTKKKGKKVATTEMSWLIPAKQFAEAKPLLTEEEGDVAHEVKEAIWESVHELVNKMTDGLPAHVDDVIRMQLTESFRFWRDAT
jgi:hypothetical protein